VALAVTAWLAAKAMPERGAARDGRENSPRDYFAGRAFSRRGVLCHAAALGHVLARPLPLEPVTLFMGFPSLCRGSLGQQACRLLSRATIKSGRWLSNSRHRRNPVATILDARFRGHDDRKERATKPVY
jgi:hypothetical protein